MEPTRQIHLDFHTSEHIPAIGADFDKKQFQEALKLGRVNLINLFAKGHHGWSYYPTKIGHAHPQLSCKNLLGEQIEACHEIGVKAPIYYTMGWSAYDAETHPEWCSIKKDGSIQTSGVSWPESENFNEEMPGFQWKNLCPTGEYHELMMAQTEEIMKTFPVDGMWYDIYQAQHACYCPNCLQEMKSKGIDIEDVSAVLKFRAFTFDRHMKAIKKLILSHHPEASVYFNGITSLDREENLKYRIHENNTKNDLEDLPTTWGGYDKFPIRSKIFHRENKPIVAMSGKFHTAWGEFGGFKDPEALRFEAASMIAYGASCNMGDQLHPSGRMDMTTYANIGHAYEYVEKIEDYGVGGKPCADLGVLLANDLTTDEGLCRMLLEEQLDFDVILPGDSLGRFDTVIVPSKAGILDTQVKDFQNYTEGGGKLLILGEGILNEQKEKTSLPCGAVYQGPAAYDKDYTLTGSKINARAAKAAAMTAKNQFTTLPETPFLNYTAALQFKLDSTAVTLAEIYEPWFSRTWAHYCGHQNTPNKTEPAAYPAAWQWKNTIVLTHNLDKMYYNNGAKVHRRFFISALGLLHNTPMAEAALPSAGRLSLLHQKEKKRYTAHLLYGAPIKRGNCSVIEDLPELYNVDVILRLPQNIKKLILIPENKELSFQELPEERKGLKGIRVSIPRFSAHCALSAEY
jgi:hypothetical protein